MTPEESAFIWLCRAQGATITEAIKAFRDSYPPCNLYEAKCVVASHQAYEKVAEAAHPLHDEVIQMVTPYKFKITDGKLVKRTGGLAEFEVQDGLNVLVGPNGSGKSTILKALADRTVQYEGERIATQYFDTEKMNPRTKAYLETSIDVWSRFASHGQIMSKVVTSWKDDLPQGPHPHLLLLDEPEAGLDLDAKLAFVQACQDMRADVRLLIATHEFMFVQAALHVIELVPGYLDKLKQAYDDIR